MKRRILLLLSLFTVLFALLTAHAGAAEIVDSGACGAEGGNLTWTLDDEGTLTIRGTGDMKTYASTDIPWSSKRLEVKKLVLEPGVTSITYCAFQLCENLTSVSIPDGVATIGENAFADCSSLEEITLPDSVTTMEAEAFYHCAGLKSVRLPDGITRLERRVFMQCYSLSAITIPDSVTSIGYSAFDETGLTSVTIPDSVVTVESYAFGNCESLTGVYVGKGVTSIQSWAFGYCESLTDIAVDPENPSYSSVSGVVFDKTQNVLYIYPAGRSGPYSVPEGVGSIYNFAFGDCDGLTRITLPEGLRFIGQGAFEGCGGLTGVTVPDSVYMIGEDAFYSCGALTSVTLGSGITSIEAHTFYGCGSLKHIVLPSGVTTLEYGAFQSCKSLTWIAIPKSLKIIRQQVFSECYIREVYYAGSEEAWAKLGLLRDATVHYNADAPTEEPVDPDAAPFGDGLGWVLEDGILSISGTGAMADFSEENPAPWYDRRNEILQAELGPGVGNLGRDAFRDCDGLIMIDVDPANGDLRSEDHVLYNRDLTALIFCPPGKAGDLILPETLREIPEGAFHHRTGLTGITVPGGVGTVGYDAFDGCTSLKRAELGEGITGIGNMAFHGCEGLTEVHIPGSVASIGFDAFDGVTGRTEVYFGAGPNKWKTVSAANDYLQKARVHFRTEGPCGENLTWKYRDGVLTISGTGDMTHYRTNGEVPWADYSTDICEAVIDAGAGRLDGTAFSRLAYLSVVYYGGPESRWPEVSQNASGALEDVFVFFDGGGHGFMRHDYGYGFENYGEPISHVIYQSVFGKVIGEILAGFSDLFGNEGQCFGMATTAGVFAGYGEPRFLEKDTGAAASVLSQVTDKDRWYFEEGLLKTRVTADTYIKYAQIFQDFPSMVAEHFASLNDLNQIAEAAKAYLEEGGEPLVITVTSDGRVHALLPLALHEDGDALNILVYDCNGNAPAGVNLKFTKEDGAYTGWLYDGGAVYSSEAEKASIYYNKSASAFRAWFPNRFVTQAWNTLTDPGFLLRVIGDRLPEGFFVPAGSENGEKGTGLTGGIRWLESGEHVTLTTEGSACTYTLASPASGVEVAMPPHATAVLDVGEGTEDKVSLQTAAGAPFTLTFYTLEEDGRLAKTTVTGTGSGTVTGTMTGEGVLLETENPENVTVTLEIEGETVSATSFSGERDRVLVRRTAEDELQVFADTDDNGTYETPVGKKKNPFTDVPEGAYYEKAVLWAVDKGITSGTSETTFSPGAGCTRGQVAAFLWRAAGKTEPTGAENPFTDVKRGAYYEKAVLWAGEKNITAGTSKTTFSPNATCTRAQIVTFLWRNAGKPEPERAVSPFTDVPEDAYYYKAILWAVEKGITAGTSKTAFSPNATCTRAQIVTFLYRNLAAN